MPRTSRVAHIGNTAVVAAKAVAWPNNDVILVAWSYPGKIPLCIGFTLERKLAGETDAKFKATDEWQGKYFEQTWENFTERLFWVSDGSPLPPLLPPTSSSGKKITPPGVKASRRASLPQK